MSSPVSPRGEQEINSIYKKLEGEELSHKYDTRKLLMGIQRHYIAIIFCILLFVALGSLTTYYYLTNYLASAVLLYKEDLPKTLPGGITLNTPSLNTALDMITMEANFPAISARLGLSLSSKDLEKMIQVPHPSNNSSLIKIECRSDNSHLAVDIANTLAKISVKRSQDLFSQQLQSELTGLTTQVTEANARLNNALDQMEKFKQSNHYFEMTADYALLINQLSEARNQVQSANLRYNSLLIEYDNLKQTTTSLPEHVEGIPSSDQRMLSHTPSSADDLQQQLSTARAKYASDNPKIKILEDQLKDFNSEDSNENSDNKDPSKIKRTIRNLTKERLSLELMRMEGKVRAAKKTKEDLVIILANLEKQLESLPKDQIEFVKLLKAKQQAEEQVDFLNKSIKTIQLMSTIPTGCFELYELSEKAKPLKDSILIKLFPFLGVIFGIISGLMLAIYFEMKDTKLRTLKQVELLYNLPALLYIPEFSFFGKKNGSEKTLYFMRYLSERIERIHASIPNPSPSLSICITSSIVHEGKSCIAYFLALYYQRLGKKVILLELDSAANSFDSTQTYVPLESYLKGEAELNSIIFMDSVARIKISEKKTLMKEWVKSAKMDDLRNFLQKEYDVIIMDLPGVIETDYTINLTAMAAVKLFVIGSSIAERKVIEESLRDLFLAGVIPSGIILNRVLPIYIEDVRIKYEMEKTKSSLWKKLLGK